MKKIALILALSLAGITSADPLPGMPLDQSPSGLLKNSRTESGDRWDFSFYGAFNEYYVGQEGLGLAFASSIIGLTPIGQILQMEFSYHPGFQCGFTVNTPFDSWIFGGDYLWIRSHNKIFQNAPTGGNLFSNLEFDSGELANFLVSLSATWKTGIDLIDLQLSRSYYMGAAWTLEPMFGFRGGWIREYLHSVSNVLSGGSNQLQTTYKFHSWNIGPRAGFQTSWLMGRGFSFFGNLSGSLLYTRYTTISAKNLQSTTFLFANNNSKGSLTPNIDTGLGIDWGIFSDGDLKHFDLSAAYNFSVFFSQNQLQAIGGVAGNGPYAGTNGSSSPGKLFFHGVSIAASFLF